jgi:hypothetical protein
MPAVRKGESRNSYVKRAVHQMVHEEGMEPKAAVGRAEGMYNSHWTGPKKKKGK